jgi:hypothetical protein
MGDETHIHNEHILANVTIIMDHGGLRREDVACIRTAAAFVALARHSRLLLGGGGHGSSSSSNAMGRESASSTRTTAAADPPQPHPDHRAANEFFPTTAIDSRKQAPPPTSASMMMKMISLPTQLPRMSSLPLNTDRSHLTHLLRMMAQRSSNNNKNKNNPRILCLHLVQQLAHQSPAIRLEWWSTHLDEIVAEMDVTVSPVRFPILEGLVEADANLAKELLPMVADHIVTIPSSLANDVDSPKTTTTATTTCEELTVWAYCAEFLMSCLVPPAVLSEDMEQLWQLFQPPPNDGGIGSGISSSSSNTGWCHLRSLARDYHHYSNGNGTVTTTTTTTTTTSSSTTLDPTVELWRQHIVAHLSEQALARMTMMMDDEDIGADDDDDEGNGGETF